MKTAKIMLFVILAILLKACGPGSGTEKPTASDTSFSFFGKTEKTHEFRDPKSGLLVSSVSYPADWEIQTRAEYKIDPMIPVFRYQIKDADGLQLFNTAMKLHYTSDDPQVERMMRNSGTNSVRRLMSTQQLIQNEIAPKLSSKGFRHLETKAFPALEEKARKEARKSSNTPMDISIQGTLWENDQGQKALVILNYGKMTQATGNGASMTAWMYGTDVLISAQEDFDRNMDDFIQSNLRSEPSAEWDNYMAQLSAKRQEETRRQAQASKARLQQAAIAHQQRMAQRQASFNAHQQKMQGIWAAQDASHASFMNRNFGSGSSTGQQDFVNMIHGEETVTHPNGTTYQIQSGAQETWMDADGNYINSNDLFFDPNANNSLNHIEWSKVWEDY